MLRFEREFVLASRDETLYRAYADVFGRTITAQQNVAEGRLEGSDVWPNGKGTRIGD